MKVIGKATAGGSITITVGTAITTEIIAIDARF